MALDDCSLQIIFGKVSDARQLAKCSMVCKQWREAYYSATCLKFTFAPKSQEQVSEQERTIATVLRTAKSKAPGCLTKLYVNINFYKSSGHWLAWADSLKSLALSADNQHLGPAVWSYILGSRTVEKLFIRNANFTTWKMPVTGWASPCLKSCEFDSVPSVSVELLQGLLAACPVLEYLCVTNFHAKNSQPVLTVSSASLTDMSVSCCRRSIVHRFELVLQHVPSLTRLMFGGACITDFAMRMVHSTDKVTVLSLQSFCSLDKVFNKVTKLILCGRWDVPEQVCSVLRYMPLITDLKFYGFSDGCIGSLLSPLLGLKHLYVDTTSMNCLDPAVKLEGVTVHILVDISETVRSLSLARIKNLFCVSGIQMLVVEVEEEGAGYRVKTKDVSHYLSELLLLYPGRVSFEALSAWEDPLKD